VAVAVAEAGEARTDPVDLAMVRSDHRGEATDRAQATATLRIRTHRLRTVRTAAQVAAGAVRRAEAVADRQAEGCFMVA
jgi:hypothetical protein